MKKKLKVFCASLLLGCLMAFPAQAAETKAEYKEAITPIRSEIEEINHNLKALREDNKASAAAYKAMRTSKKENGSLTIDKADWKKAKELHSQIASIRKNMEKSSIKGLHQNARTAVKQKDYDAALQTMENILDIKEQKLKDVKQLHEIWQEIDELLAQ